MLATFLFVFGLLCGAVLGCISINPTCLQGAPLQPCNSTTLTAVGHSGDQLLHEQHVEQLMKPERGHRAELAELLAAAEVALQQGGQAVAAAHQAKLAALEEAHRGEVAKWAEMVKGMRALLAEGWACPAAGVGGTTACSAGLAVAVCSGPRHGAQPRCVIGNWVWR